ncbi:hypothetical protein NUH88_21500 [Nisaea acidiphila]|uniref:Uncharacterized protein n=1 Tax=Nisaea acidiphila TaxID=1862145 RepID=A0A9J7ARS4_9PROT|nr:hypothetical protein [Nisaea acidiphila]UUX49951.1 hypothetical protein NUH88_21500 [Nisaea acidiphila]
MIPSFSAICAREDEMKTSIVKLVIGLSLVAGLWSPDANAQAKAPSVEILDEAALDSIRDWLENPVVEMSILAHNKRYKDVDQAKIDALDKAWGAERESADQPLIAATLSSPLSAYLTQIQAASDGIFTEIFVMDAFGLNVGQSSITSDFWQGDEAKFQKTFAVGPDAVFIDEPEFHESSNTWRTQVNLTIAKDGKPIGAVTVEYNLSELARRRGMM